MLLTQHIHVCVVTMIVSFDKNAPVGANFEWENKLTFFPQHLPTNKQGIQIWVASMGAISINRQTMLPHLRQLLKFITK